MKHIYDMEALMHRTGITDYVELQKQGYDVVFYLKEKQKKLQSQVEELQHEIEQIECNSKENEKETPDSSFMDLLDEDSSSYDDSSYDSSFDDDFGPDMGFDESRISDPDYVYIGT